MRIPLRYTSGIDMLRPYSRRLTCITTNTCQTRREILGQINRWLVDQPNHAEVAYVLRDVHQVR